MSISTSNLRAPLGNPVVDALLNRRSCRHFKPEPLARDEVRTIVVCGLYAATARGLEPWRFFIVLDPALLDEIAEAARVGMLESGLEAVRHYGEDPDFHCFYHAPAVVLLCGDGSVWSPLDCANAAQNMCLAAHSLGVGSCYIGLVRHAFQSSRGPALRERLGIPEGFTPLASVALGYPDGPVEGNPRRTPAHVRWVE